MSLITSKKSLTKKPFEGTIAIPRNGISIPSPYPITDSKLLQRVTVETLPINNISEVADSGYQTILTNVGVATELYTFTYNTDYILRSVNIGCFVISPTSGSNTPVRLEFRWASIGNGRYFLIVPFFLNPMPITPSSTAALNLLNLNLRIPKGTELQLHMYAPNGTGAIYFTMAYKMVVSIEKII